MPRSLQFEQAGRGPREPRGRSLRSQRTLYDDNYVSGLIVSELLKRAPPHTTSSASRELLAGALGLN